MSSELHPTELLDISSGVPACLYEGIAPFYARGPFDEAEMWQEVVQQTPIPHQMPSVPRALICNFTWMYLLRVIDYLPPDVNKSVSSLYQRIEVFNTLIEGGTASSRHLEGTGTIITPAGVAKRVNLTVVALAEDIMWIAQEATTTTTTGVQPQVGLYGSPVPGTPSPPGTPGSPSDSSPERDSESKLVQVATSRKRKPWDASVMKFTFKSNKNRSRQYEVDS